MTRHTLRLAGLLLVAASLVLAGCSTPADPSVEPPPALTPATSTTAPHTASPSAEPVPDPTCDAIIPATTVADFASVGWSVKAQPFRIGAEEIPGGVQCTWGDYTTATDHVQIFGWAPIAAADAETAQATLVGEGWKKEEGTAGVYVTEAANSAIATDADGYGVTYLFGDGWVTFADTKQGLLLVEWPPAK